MTNNIQLIGRYVLYTIIILFFAEMAFSFIAGLGWYIYNPDAMDDIPKLVIVSSAGSIAGIFFGSLFATCRFPKEATKSVITGAVAAVSISKIIDIFTTGIISPEVFSGLVISCITAFIGIMAGQIIIKRRGKSGPPRL